MVNIHQKDFIYVFSPYIIALFKSITLLPSAAGCISGLSVNEANLELRQISFFHGLVILYLYKAYRVSNEDILIAGESSPHSNSDYGPC